MVPDRSAVPLDFLLGEFAPDAAEATLAASCSATYAGGEYHRGHSRTSLLDLFAWANGTDTRGTLAETLKEMSRIELDGLRHVWRARVQKNQTSNPAQYDREKDRNNREQARLYWQLMGQRHDELSCSLDDVLKGRAKLPTKGAKPVYLLYRLSTGRYLDQVEELFLAETATFEGVQAAYCAAATHDDSTPFARLFFLARVRPPSPDGSDGEATSALVVRLPEDCRELMKPALSARTRGMLGLAGVDARLRGRKELCLVLEGTTAEHGAAIDAFAETVLREVAIGTRPVLGWRASFVQPFRMPGADEKAWKRAVNAVSQSGDWKKDVLNDEAKAYFLPQVRQEGENRQSRLPDSYERDAQGLSLEIDSGMSNAPDTIPIKSLRLHLFDRDTFALEWILEGPEPRPTAPLGRALWKELASAAGQAKSEQHCGRSLAEVTDLVSRARFIFSTNKATEPGGSAKRVSLTLLDGRADRPKRSETLEVLSSVTLEAERPTAWLKALLYAVLPDGFANPENLRIVGDNRARVVASVVLAGLPSSEERLEPALARLRMVDPWGAGHFYDTAFSREDLAAGHYRRFAEAGSHFLVTDHSFCFLGFGTDYALPVIHEQMDSIYRHMALTTPLYSAALESYQDWADEIVKHVSTKKPRHKTLVELEKLQAALVRFRNQRLFDRMSGQVQGQELYRMIRDQSAVADELKALDAEIERIEGYVNARAQTELAQRSALGSSAVAVFGISTALYALAQTARRDPGVASWLDRASCSWGIVADLLLPMASALLIWGMAVAFGALQWPVPGRGWRTKRDWVFYLLPALPVLVVGLYAIWPLGASGPENCIPGETFWPEFQRAFHHLARFSADAFLKLKTLWIM